MSLSDPQLIQFPESRAEAPTADTPAEDTAVIVPAPKFPTVPTVGCIVHFVMHGEVTSQGQHRPAIIVALHEDTINLQVFTDGHHDGLRYEDGMAWRTEVHQDETDKLPGTWHWPEA